MLRLNNTKAYTPNVKPGLTISSAGFMGQLGHEFVILYIADCQGIIQKDLRQDAAIEKRPFRKDILDHRPELSLVY